MTMLCCKLPAATPARFFVLIFLQISAKISVNHRQKKSIFNTKGVANSRRREKREIRFPISPSPLPISAVSQNSRSKVDELAMMKGRLRTSKIIK
ncbi:hypothetical protein ACS0TY_035313 [Phlomoides rotata]